MIQYQILIRIAWQTVRRITNKILGVKGLGNLNSLLNLDLIFISFSCYIFLYIWTDQKCTQAKDIINNVPICTHVCCNSWWSRKLSLALLPLNSQDLISNSPYCLLYSSCNVSLENLVLDQLIIPWLTFFFFLLLVCLILYWYCKEKFCLGHSWEFKG